MEAVFRAIAGFTGGLVLFLSLWIVVPAPVFALLPLGIVAPELSPYLIVLSAIAAGSSLRSKARLPLTGSALALLLSLLPLLQFPAVSDRAQAAFAQTFEPQTFEPQTFETAPAVELVSAIASVFGGVELTSVRHTAGIEFARPQGQPLHLEVYRPPQVGRYPAIVTIYGGAWQQGEPSGNAQFNRYMAARGYVVWAIDYRHAPQFRFPAQLEDVRTALEFIRGHAEEYETDSERIALMGRSAGAHLAMLAAYEPDALPIRAVVSYYGPVDLTEGYADPPRPDPIDTRAVLKAFLGGTPTELPDLYRQASPYQCVTRSNLPPTLLVYGRRDHIVQAKFGRALAERLRSRNVPNVMIELPWSEHAFDAVFRGLGNQIALAYTERFFEVTLRSQ